MDLEFRNFCDGQFYTAILVTFQTLVENRRTEGFFSNKTELSIGIGIGR